MKAKIQSKPIKSRQLITAIGTQVLQEGIEFYVLYHTILNCKYTASELLSFSVDAYHENVYDKYSFNKIRDLGEMLSIMTKDKKGSDLLFTSGGIPISPAKIRSVFHSVEIKLPSDISLTVTSLRQTYFYNLWLRTHDIRQVRNEANRRTIRETYEYIDVPYYEYIPAAESSDHLLASNFAEKTLLKLETFTQKQKNLVDSLQDGAALDADYASALYEFLETVSQKIDEFDAFIN